jgi:hypothetical protein
LLNVTLAPSPVTASMSASTCIDALNIAAYTRFNGSAAAAAAANEPWKKRRRFMEGSRLLLDLDQVRWIIARTRVPPHAPEHRVDRFGHRRTQARNARLRSIKPN